MVSAVIMAGGKSSRMRNSLGCEHKGLVKVLGISMLERNLLALLSHGCREIFLAINTRERSLLTFARSRAAQLAHACNADLKLVLERQPLGTIGAAARIRTSSDDLLVVNVDNLTTLDLTAFVRHHQTAKAAMTIATHEEPFTIPFGQVSIKKGFITEYQEKPTLSVSLSSGTYVLNKWARSIIPHRGPVGAPELVHTLLRRRAKVAAFEHSSHWIDVNDSISVQRAEELIRANFQDFEWWREPPQRHVAIVCILNNHNIAVSTNGCGMRSLSGLPALELARREPPEDAAVRYTHEVSAPVKGVRVLVSFDEIDAGTEQRTRYHVVLAEFAKRHRTNAIGELKWTQINELSAMIGESYGCSRALSYLSRYTANSHSVGH